MLTLCECPYCGFKFTPGERYCTYCGASNPNSSVLSPTRPTSPATEGNVQAGPKNLRNEPAKPTYHGNQLADEKPSLEIVSLSLLPNAEAAHHLREIVSMCRQLEELWDECQVLNKGKPKPRKAMQWIEPRLRLLRNTGGFEDRKQTRRFLRTTIVMLFQASSSIPPGQVRLPRKWIDINRGDNTVQFSVPCWDPFRVPFAGTVAEGQTRNVLLSECNGAFMLQFSVSPNSPRLDAAFVERMELELWNPVSVSWVAKRYGNNAMAFLANQKGFCFENGKVFARKYQDLRSLKDYYGLLNLPPDTTPDEVLHAYENKLAEDDDAEQTHEHRYGRAGGGNWLEEVDHERHRDNWLRTLTEAKDILSDPERKREYDRQISLLEEPVLRQVRLTSFRFLALGGASEIGRSCYYVRVGGHYVLFDGGISQEKGKDLLPRIDLLERLPPVEAVFVSHAHADHTGALERMMEWIPQDVKFYMTRETKVILWMILGDRINKKTIGREEATSLLHRCVTIKLNEENEINGLKFKFLNAGHIIGSSMVFLKSRAEDRPGDDSVLFTGDINFEATELETPASPVDDTVRTLITEATYAGEKPRSSREERERELVDIVSRAVNCGKKVLIPAFAIERTAAVLMILDRAMEEGRVNPRVELFTAGLGAAIIRSLEKSDFKHVKYLGLREDQEDIHVLCDSEDPFPERKGRGVDMDGIIQDLKQRFVSGPPCILVAGSGMADRGLIAKLIPDILDRESVLFLIVGYQAPGSTGEVLHKIKKGVAYRFGRELVTAGFDVEEVGLSGHTDEAHLLNFIQEQAPEKLIVVHSKRHNATTFARNFGRFRAVVPWNLEVIFDCLTTGAQLMPFVRTREELSGEPYLLCEDCGGGFYDPWLAARHEKETGHTVSKSERDNWYRFWLKAEYTTPLAELLRPREIKERLKLVLAASKTARVRHFECPLDRMEFYIQGYLSDEDTANIERDMTSANGYMFKVKFADKTPIVVVSSLDNKPIRLGNIRTKLQRFIANDFLTPYRLNYDAVLPPRVAGEYKCWRRSDGRIRSTLSISSRVTDPEDYNLVVTHELAHHVQYTFNRWLFTKESHSAPPDRAVFVEGFANYAAASLGCSKKLLVEWHEKVAPEQYYRGRRLYEDIEFAYGKEKAIEVALKGKAGDLLNNHLELHSPLLTEALKRSMEVVKQNGIWKRYCLFWVGISPWVRREMRKYVLTNWRTVYKEFEGWSLRLVVDDVICLSIADFMKSTHKAARIERGELAKTIRALLLFGGMYKKFYNGVKEKIELSKSETVSSPLIVSSTGPRPRP